MRGFNAFAAWWCIGICATLALSGCARQLDTYTSHDDVRVRTGALVRCKNWEKPDSTLYHAFACYVDSGSAFVHGDEVVQPLWERVQVPLPPKRDCAPDVPEAPSIGMDCDVQLSPAQQAAVERARRRYQREVVQAFYEIDLENWKDGELEAQACDPVYRRHETTEICDNGFEASDGYVRRLPRPTLAAEELSHADDVR